jgi:hypothetical protein
MTNPNPHTSKQIDELYEALYEILGEPEFDHPSVGKFGLFDISPTKTSDVWGVTLTENIIELFKAQLTAIIESAERKARIDELESHRNLTGFNKGDIHLLSDEIGERIDQLNQESGVS